ncbi:hypothetical protein CC85DRAFT_127128 [Cutaneotrichosporon oleaginosum]|uniref:Uncharacterized protein n=1 Tax=Cutaneotrichosporon oleaginosum TaxID=879819 RepID=A0A0J0XJ74_9TREE|nr:uncharacterized protein CC85DRAFT_127128 [Cutaneotrichosporon oleaginosum]KLT41155.1 hypothetical protein CC85DRAFT_127128 [Cutaneotrichosporon oleaginosum]TXT14127.1 hypothetical protein COLE_00320 [Cutaneotrichosporon oleaginosum]
MNRANHSLLPRLILVPRTLAHSNTRTLEQSNTSPAHLVTPPSPIARHHITLSPLLASTSAIAPNISVSSSYFFSLRPPPRVNMSSTTVS